MRAAAATISLLVSMVLGAEQAHPESPMACLDPDVANTLLQLPGQASPTFSTTIPPGHQLPAMPGSFELIGSRTMQNAALVAYTSNQEPAAAISAIRAEPNPDWVTSDSDTPILFGGFRLRESRTPDTTFQLCRDRVGQARVSVRASESSGSYATVLLYKNKVVCSEVNNRRFVEVDRPRIPLLLLPDDAELLDSLGTGGGSNTVSTGSVFKTALPMATTIASFNDQLLDQGWTMEASWSGSNTQGSSWISGDGASYGVLSVAALSAGAFQGIFNAVSLRQPEGAAGSSSAISIMTSN